ncbi:T9SS type A sorting domain-containing protein [Lewinella sp. IMCC34191]|uniref:T9SS type A sorting domain-containing protein n=1 Tax=Lewinella sp. IMCC34191 TaxID=2259172 RepID=UPI000E25DEE4|nr:T9SS type A sorting domain-containing protein [Lewinella sp. IMCC34191]
MDRNFILVVVLMVVSFSGIWAQSALSVSYFDTYGIPAFDTTDMAASTTTFIINGNCKTLQLQVTDPENDPQPVSTPYAVRVLNADGDSIKDLTGNVNVTMRVYTPETVTVAALFRSGDGASGSRTQQLNYEVPGSTSSWTEFTLTFEGDDLGGLAPSDIRDFWFYLDPNEENFAGNQFVIDHLAIGGTPDPTRYSPCDLVSDVTEPEWAQSLSVFPNPTGGNPTLAIEGRHLGAARLHVELRDVMGQRIQLPYQAITSERTLLQIDDLPAATYLLFIMDGAGGRAIRPIIKQ